MPWLFQPPCLIDSVKNDGCERRQERCKLQVMRMCFDWMEGGHLEIQAHPSEWVEALSFYPLWQGLSKISSNASIALRGLPFLMFAKFWGFRPVLLPWDWSTILNSRNLPTFQSPFGVDGRHKMKTPNCTPHSKPVQSLSDTMNALIKEKGRKI